MVDEIVELDEDIFFDELLKEVNKEVEKELAKQAERIKKDIENTGI